MQVRSWRGTEGQFDFFCPFVGFKVAGSLLSLSLSLSLFLFLFLFLSSYVCLQLYIICLLCFLIILSNYKQFLTLFLFTPFHFLFIFLGSHFPHGRFFSLVSCRYLLFYLYLLLQAPPSVKEMLMCAAMLQVGASSTPGVSNYLLHIPGVAAGGGGGGRRRRRQ